MGNIVAIVVIIIVVIVFLNNLGTMVIDKSVGVPTNQWYRVKFYMDEGDVAASIIKCEEGGPIDVFLCSSTGYENYESLMFWGFGTFYSYHSSRSVYDDEFTFTAPESGYYYLILDNAGIVEGGASPRNHVRVKVQLKTLG